MTHRHTEYSLRASGFTLIELLVVLVLVGAVAVWGVPRFQSLGERTAVTSEVNRLQSALSLARSTAITQQGDITLCPASTNHRICLSDWSGELMIVNGDKTRDISQDEIVRLFPPTSGVDVSKNGHARIKYTSLGHATGFNSTFSICPRHAAGRTQGADLVLSVLGRARVVETPIDC
ncbi:MULTISPECIES: GspH/FimT family pseudopilin [Halomonas]|uniref:GspH/FimT family pseudopilin n=1 Tax=Halomonas TaxID=2745 RepID=UPI0018661426|nr:GspH/FimT family pseudopilin [Halomonas colorata]